MRKEYKIGDAFPVIKSDEITRVQLVKYAGASGDFNPLHTVEEVGEKAGTGVIAHGMLIMGIASREITKWFPRKKLKKFSVRFKGMTRPGESIQITGTVIEIRNDHILVGEVLASNLQDEVKMSGTFEVEIKSK
ncbi:MaoC/PaaZ C-terminal domain-containing protein [Oceanobacillus sp. CF4.6]|uniref:MaoC/PaaZ C-terminal domain-containing protein n=1 Tax=Oceanobacillus sp. CF4.6 TaxID=3373080 RepID=UPI003EE5AADE